MSALALKLDDRDSVASLLADVGAQGAIDVHLPDGSTRRVTATEDIHFGHKIALEPIQAGALITKYGVAIGRATLEIKPGQLVHVHNVAGLESAVGGARVRPLEESSSDGGGRYPAEPLREWVQRIGIASDIGPDAARDLADSIIDAELSGVQTHGLRRLPAYLQRVAVGAVDGHAAPTLRSKGSMIEVDGHNGVGAHILKVTADAAVQCAKATGVGLGLVRNSNHAGALGWAASHIARCDMVAIIVSNGPPLIAAPGATESFLSNSPIAIAAPLLDGEVFLVDMATSAVSRDKIRQAAEAGLPIPSGWALDSSGAPTQDARAAMAGALLPIGGSERGFALILALEILSGVLPGALTDILVPSKDAGKQPEGIGHFVLAIDPGHHSCGHSLTERMSELEARLTGLATNASEQPRLPGRRREHMRKKAVLEGIAVPESTLDLLSELAATAGCPLPPEMTGGGNDGIA